VGWMRSNAAAISLRPAYPAKAAPEKRVKPAGSAIARSSEFAYR
jgi:hypothetical protein